MRCPDENPLTATASDLSEVRQRLISNGADHSVDIAWAGRPSDVDGYVEIADAGATWQIEPVMGDESEIIARVREGPMSPSSD